MANPGIQALRAGPEMLSGTAIPFRFDITWRSLTRPLAPTAASAVMKPPNRRAPTAPVRSPVAEAKEWEMVLPRMKRPAALAPPGADTSVAAPSFGVTPDVLGGKRWILFAGAPVLILTVAVFLFGGKSAAPGASSATMEMGSAGWITERASDAARPARGPQISLYRPSPTM